MPVQQDDLILVEREGNLYKAYLADLAVGSETPSQSAESNPTLTYTGSFLTRIDYQSGNYKTFEYENGLLVRVEYHTPRRSTRKTLSYQGGRLIQVLETEI